MTSRTEDHRLMLGMDTEILTDSSQHAPADHRKRAQEHWKSAALKIKTVSTFGKTSSKNSSKTGTEKTDEEDSEEEEEETDKRPPPSYWSQKKLPCALVASLCAGGVVLRQVHARIVEEFFSSGVSFSRVVLGTYAVTLSAMAVTSLSSPGYLTDAAEKEVSCGTRAAPKRSHSSAKEPHLILRRDHYCRWITNTIGLANHRPFMVMTTGFVTMGIAGSLVGLTLLTKYLRAQRLPHPVVVAHLVQSAVFFRFVYPIWRLHVGFVSRNELAKEWCDNEFYVLIDKETNIKTSALDLDNDVYNNEFDNFVYDPDRNPWDRKSCLKNCFAFWWTSRWSSYQNGEF